MNGVLRERRALYDLGLNDADIGRRQGVDRSAVCMWRKRNGLVPNASDRLSQDNVSPMRRLLHNMGWGVGSIAQFQRVSPETVKDWRTRNGLTLNREKTRLSEHQKTAQLKALQRRVVRSIGSWLPFDIAADAAAELMLAVIEGDVPLNEIEKQGRLFGNRALREYANPFSTRSLDEERPDHEGLRPIDMLVDGSSSAWLEEMGATVH